MLGAKCWALGAGRCAPVAIVKIKLNLHKPKQQHIIQHFSAEQLIKSVDCEFTAVAAAYWVNKIDTDSDPVAFDAQNRIGNIACDRQYRVARGLLKDRIDIHSALLLTYKSGLNHVNKIFTEILVDMYATKVMSEDLYKKYCEELHVSQYIGMLRILEDLHNNPPVKAKNGEFSTFVRNIATYNMLQINDIIGAEHPQIGKSHTLRILKHGNAMDTASAFVIQAVYNFPKKLMQVPSGMLKAHYDMYETPTFNVHKLLTDVAVMDRVPIHVEPLLIHFLGIDTLLQIDSKISMIEEYRFLKLAH